MTYVARSNGKDALATQGTRLIAPARHPAHALTCSQILSFDLSHSTAEWQLMSLPIDLKRMRYVLEVARADAITTAAETLGVTQSASVSCMARGGC